MIVDEKECLYLSLIFLLIICFGCRIFERNFILYMYIDIRLFINWKIFVYRNLFFFCYGKMKIINIIFL